MESWTWTKNVKFPVFEISGILFLIHLPIPIILIPVKVHVNSRTKYKNCIFTFDGCISHGLLYEKHFMHF